MVLEEHREQVNKMNEIIKQGIESLKLLFDTGILKYAFVLLPSLFLVESIIWKLKGE